MSITIVGTPFYYPLNAGEVKFVNSKSSGFDVYHNCIVQFFYNIKKKTSSDGEIKFVLFTNKLPPFSIKKQLDDIGVEIEIVYNFDAVENKNINNNFPGCMFLLDVLKHCSSNHDSNILLLDSDIYTNEKIHIESEFESSDIVYFPQRYDENKFVNGQSIKSLTELNFMQCGHREPIEFCGGEFIYLSKEIVKEFTAACFSWIEKLSTREVDLTEEHILSLSVSNFKNKKSSRDLLIKRLWNTRGFNNLSGEEPSYVFLHIPAEKDLGFRISYLKSKMNKYSNLCDYNFESKKHRFYFVKIVQKLKIELLEFLLKKDKW